MIIKTYLPGKPLSEYYQLLPYYGRTKICFLTDDLEIVSEKTSNGWTFNKTPHGFYLEAPETWLVDIIEPTKIRYFTKNLIDNYAYYLYLKSQKNNLITLTKNILNKKNAEIFLSHGSALETEIRIITNSKKDGKKIKTALHAHFLKDINYGQFIDKSKRLLGKTNPINVKKNKKISDYPKNIQYFFNNIKKHYSLINFGKKKIYNRYFINGLSAQVESLFNSADVLIFVPWGCFNYIGSFISPKNIKKIMLWEFHMSIYNKHQHKFQSKNLNNKKIAIFDKSYTGGTLNNIAEAVKKQGGEPIKVALFPKSRSAIKNSDYIVFLDQIIKSSMVDISSPQWYNLLYKYYFNNKQYDRK